jgi:hypothetical protein
MLLNATEEAMAVASAKLNDLFTQKLAAREKLRAARAEIAALDTKLHSAGAKIADINAVCW